MSKFTKTIEQVFYTDKPTENISVGFELPSGESLIHIAIINNDRELVKLIVEKRKEMLEWRNEQGKSPFSLAISFGNEIMADFLIGLGANIETKTRTFKVISEGKYKTIERNDIPTLIEMVINGNKSMVEFLLKKGCHIDCVDSLGFTPLNYAMFLNRKDIIKILIRGKCDINIFPNYETFENILKIGGEDVIIETGGISVFKSPLFIASLYGDDDIFKLIIGGTTTFKFYDEAGCCVLNHLLKKKRFDRIMEIIKVAGKYENHYNMNGDCLAHEIVRELDEPFEIIRFLASKGLDFEKKNMEGKTIMAIGVEKAKKKIVFIKKIKKLGAEVKEEDFDDRKEIFNAIPKDDLDTIKAILKDKTRVIDLKMLNSDGQSFIHVSVFYQKTEIIDFFLKMVPSLINLENSENLTPFYYAIHNKKTESIAFLLNKFKDVEKSGKLIYYLVKTNDSTYSEIIKSLIENGHCINYQEESDKLNTPLHIAIENDNHEIATILIANGAKMDVKNVKGITPATIMRKLPASSRIKTIQEMRMKYGGGVM